jgi:hypothetical protein
MNQWNLVKLLQAVGFQNHSSIICCMYFKIHYAFTVVTLNRIFRQFMFLKLITLIGRTKLFITTFGVKRDANLLLLYNSVCLKMIMFPDRDGPSHVVCLFQTFTKRSQIVINWSYPRLYTKVKVKLSLCLTKHHAMKAYWGSAGIAPRILDLGSRWRWVVNFTPLPLYPQGKSPWYPLDRRLGGPQSRSERGGEEKNSQPPPEIEP